MYSLQPATSTTSTMSGVSYVVVYTPSRPDDDGLAGVREPRRPLPDAPPALTAREPDVDPI